MGSRLAADGDEGVDEANGFGLEFHGLAVVFPFGDGADGEEALEFAALSVAEAFEGADEDLVGDAGFFGFDFFVEFLEGGDFAVFVVRASRVVSPMTCMVLTRARAAMPKTPRAMMTSKRLMPRFLGVGRGGCIRRFR